MSTIHGGDIYRNRVTHDFSVNVNPLGIPKSVKRALYKAVSACDAYPDIHAEHLKKAVAETLCIPEQFLLFGNGASELFMAIMHGIRPQKTVIAVPSFYGYEYAAKAAEATIVYYETKESEMFRLGPDLLSVLTDDVQALFLANPNNPTGTLADKQFLKCLLTHCRERKIRVILDECFIEFVMEEESLLQETANYENLILVRAFTKLFSIPGVRLGYLVCSDEKLRNQIKAQLPEWNLSVFAQEAGVVCAKESDFSKRTAAYVKRERAFLETALSKLGMRSYPGAGNFLLFHSKIPLYEPLLQKGILIRDCRNFRGLQRGFYRIAVKSRRENKILLNRIGEVIREYDRNH